MYFGYHKMYFNHSMIQMRKKSQQFCSFNRILSLFRDITVMNFT